MKNSTDQNAKVYQKGTKKLPEKSKTLERLLKKLTTLQNKKDDCVKKQFELDDNNLTHTKKYEKLIELDFDLAEQILDISRLIRNEKAKIKRKGAKND